MPFLELPCLVHLPHSHARQAMSQSEDFYASHSEAGNLSDVGTFSSSDINANDETVPTVRPAPAHEVGACPSMNHGLVRTASQVHRSSNLMDEILPTEVLSLIFSFCLPYFLRHIRGSGPLIFGAVSKKWRETAWSTPNLWSSISIIIDFNPQRLSHQTALAEEWLARSGQRELSIQVRSQGRHIDDVMEDTEIDYLVFIMRPLIGVIVQYSYRWKSLELLLPTCLFNHIIPRSNNAPLLERLQIEPPKGSSRPGDALKFHFTPLLRRVDIKDLKLKTLELQWDFLTHFSGVGMTVDECLEVFRRTRRLKHCRFAKIGPNGSEFPIPPNEDQILVWTVQRLQLNHRHNFGRSYLFNTLTLPSLISLQYEGNREMLPVAALSVFITRSRCALTLLALSAVVVSDVDLIDFLKLLPALEILQLRSPRGDWIGMSDLLLHYFSLNPLPESAVEVAKFLPFLTTLHYSGRFTFSWASLAKMFPIAVLVEDEVVPLSIGIQQPTLGEAPNFRRRPLHSVIFNFYENRKAERIPAEVLPRLVAALNDGVGIKIFHWESLRGTDMLKREIMEFEATSNIRLVPSNMQTAV